VKFDSAERSDPVRVPLSWLREYVDLPEDQSGREVGDRLVRAGLEVETVESFGHDVTGPLVIGEVLSFTDEKHSNGKTIRWCSVDVGEGEPRGIVCGALNFAVGDRVPVALPGCVLPGGFAITARKTYGHVSDGMICSARELGLGDEHSGILVLSDRPDIGADAAAVLELRDDVLDIAVTPDRGYALSVRGVAREAATAYAVELRDPAAVDAAAPAAGTTDGWPVRIEDESGCDRFVAVTVTGFDPGAPSPLWLQRRLARGGMRPISLAVDVTNYVMLELGHPLHAYDRAKLRGTIVVRRARAGERIETLDGTTRKLDADDLLITDDSGPIGIAGVMGGASTEVSAETSDVVLEAAHFDPATIARAARRHKLPSEASRRFERGVDSALGWAAARVAADLLVRLGGGRVEPGVTVVGEPPAREALEIPLDLPSRVVGTAYDDAGVVSALTAVGCAVEQLDDRRLRVTPPTWRPDLTDPYDLVEEVARLHGYDAIPPRLPVAPAGRGLTESQRQRRRVGRALAAAGCVEAPSYPFVGEPAWDALGLPADDARRQALRLLNPLSDEEPLLRTTLLPGLLAALRRNVGRGTSDVALFEIGQVFRPRPDAPTGAPALGVDRRPTAEELAAQEAALPDQPTRVAAVLAGDAERPGWWGAGRPAGWADAVELARRVAREYAVELEVARDDHAPWHPGRCAVLRAGGTVVGHAGELHPRVVAALSLPPRSSALELDLDLLAAASGGLVQAPTVSTYPVATQDVALVVEEGVPAAEVLAALRDGAGPLLEDLRLFDVYTGDQIGTGAKSLAFALRFRAQDRTLTVEEVTAARDAAVAEAARRTGAVLRGA
jgi:phenylalanyl-tRNA synthetase beta chain